jgi:glycosidase
MKKNIFVPLLAFLVTALTISCGSKSAGTPNNNNNNNTNDTVPVVTPPNPDSTITYTQYGTPFSNVPSPENAVIYEVNIRAFSPGGNFSGVTARLDSIQALGVNVIYLMPIYPVGVVKSINSPYCVEDYLSVNPYFGTLADLRALVDAAHALNMSVMLDWVANHTSWDNPWITEHKEWYAQDGSGNIVSPAGYNDVAQLNYNNQYMRIQMIADMKYWVYAANVDGFRCDYADNIPENFWAQDIDTLRAISTHKLLLLAEGSRDSNYLSGFDYNFGFNFYGNLKSIYSSNLSVQSIDGLNSADYVDASGTQQIVRYTTNHDVNSSDGTPLQLFGGNNGSMAAFAVAALMRSVPFIYDGQEVGMTTPITFPFTTVKIDWTENIPMTALYKTIISFRANNVAVREAVPVSYSSADVCAFTKTYNSNEVLVIANMLNETTTYTTPTALVNTQWTNASDGTTFTATSQITLQPYQYLLLHN